MLILWPLFIVVEHYIQTYSEPPAPDANGAIPAIPSTASSSADQVTLPLGPGTLTKNLGVPIAVVCCKVRHRDIMKSPYLVVTSYLQSHPTLQPLLMA